MSQLFGTDRVLLYDVDPWNRLGFGVPNFGENVGGVNVPVANLVNEIGKAQLHIMTHVDARRTEPPSRNTIERVGKVLNRIQRVLGLRRQGYNELRLEPGHAAPAPVIFTIHPTPYFQQPYTPAGVPQNYAFVRNPWLSEYNNLVMLGLSNLMQHSDNNIALTITDALATQTYVYFKEIALRMGTELLGLPKDTVMAEGFEFDETHYAAYDPSKVVLDFQAIDHPGMIWTTPTEDDLRPLLTGIPANLIVPCLKQFPIGPVPGMEGISGQDELAGAGAGSSGGGSGGASVPPPSI